MILAVIVGWFVIYFSGMLITGYIHGRIYYKADWDSFICALWPFFLMGLLIEKTMTFVCKPVKHFHTLGAQHGREKNNGR